MARTALPLINPPGKYPAVPLGAGSADFVLTAGDNVNGNSFASSGREVLLVQNTDAGAQTVTVHSVPDAFGRSADITTYSLAAGAFAVLGPFPVSGWKQNDGTIWVDCSAATIKFAVLTLPALS